MFKLFSRKPQEKSPEKSPLDNIKNLDNTLNGLNLTNILQAVKRQPEKDKLRIIQESISISFEDIKKHFDQGTEYLKNRSPSKALKKFEESVQIADEILLISELISTLGNNAKLELANIYITCAKTKKECGPLDSVAMHYLIEKTLELDPENQDARSLKFDMNFEGVLIQKV